MVTPPYFLMIAGSRQATADMLSYTRRVVQRAHELNWSILVGDNPQGVDRTVMMACAELNITTTVIGISEKPRFIVEGLHYVRWGKNYTERDKHLVDLCSQAMFIWNGISKGTHKGYEYAQSVEITAYLKTFV